MKFQTWISIFRSTSSDPTVSLNVTGLDDIRSWRIMLVEPIAAEVALPTLPVMISSYWKVRAPFPLLFSNKHLERKRVVFWGEIWNVGYLPALARRGTCTPSQIEKHGLYFLTLQRRRFHHTSKELFWVKWMAAISSSFYFFEWACLLRKAPVQIEPVDCDKYPIQCK